MEYRITDDLDRLLGILPQDLVESLEVEGNQDELLEIIMDLGRQASARYTYGTVVLSTKEITSRDIDEVVSQVGMFDADNRAGMARTLHRISAIRNRQHNIVGLTCRVGRAVYGTIDIIEDIITSGKSVLLLGPPGVGKTTILREAARVLSEIRRVVIVDTSNEIGGDGDVPHPAIGQARRMQVAQPALQHEVMIEAVENHNPQVIIIDEIGRELEALAARTIAERGVQLVGTAHGNTLENLLRNPTLSDLVGGIESVTLSDEEARRRRTQKSVLERRSPPTFDVLIEIKARAHLVIHDDLAGAVDAQLRGHPLPVEVRMRDEAGNIDKHMAMPESTIQRESYDPRFSRQPTTQALPPIQNGSGGRNKRNKGNGNNGHANESFGYTLPDEDFTVMRQPHPDVIAGDKRQPEPIEVAPEEIAGVQNRKVKIYAYGVARNRLYGGAARLGVNIEVVEMMTEADAIVTLKTYYRRRPKIIMDAERRNIPIHVLRANTEAQVDSFLADLFEVDNWDDPTEHALAEARAAIRLIQSGEAVEVDLEPQDTRIRRLQHELAERENLHATSIGDQAHRFVRIFADDINS